MLQINYKLYTSKKKKEKKNIYIYIYAFEIDIYPTEIKTITNKFN